MPVCDRCRRMKATAELRRRRPPYEGEFRCKDACKPYVIPAGSHVDTPIGEGVIMNHVLQSGAVIEYLVLLDADRGVAGNMNPEAVWRCVKPEAVTA